MFVTEYRMDIRRYILNISYGQLSAKLPVILSSSGHSGHSGHLGHLGHLGHSGHLGHLGHSGHLGHLGQSGNMVTN